MIRLHKKSFASRIQTSQGIISPELKCIVSPGTTSSSGSSIFDLLRQVTLQVVVIIARSFSAAFPLLDSCTKRKVPESRTIVRIMMTVRRSKSSGVFPSMLRAGKIMSVAAETKARAINIAAKEFLVQLKLRHL